MFVAVSRHSIDTAADHICITAQSRLTSGLTGAAPMIFRIQTGRARGVKCRPSVRRHDGFQRDLIQTRAKAVEHNLHHAETFTDEESLDKLSGANTNQRCSGFVVDGIESKTKKLTAQAATMEVAPDHCPCEISHTIRVHGPTSAGSDLAE